jgi:hypothetical protein
MSVVVVVVFMIWILVGGMAVMEGRFDVVV